MKQKHHGLTLVEVAVSTVIVGVMLVAALETLGAVLRSQRLNAARLTGPGLAHEIMGEILSLPYEDPENPGGSIGTDSGESSSDRTAFDDVDDYDNWSENGPEGKDGAGYSDYTGWERDVQVDWVNSTTLAVAGSDTGLKRITVTVTDPDGVETQISALRSQLSSLEQSPAVDMTAVTWLGTELQLGGATVAHSSTQLSNHVYDTN